MIVRGNISAEKSRSIIGEHSSDLPKNESRSSRVIHPNFISRFPVRLPFECNPELLCIVLGHIQNRVGLRETSSKRGTDVGSQVWTLRRDASAVNSSSLRDAVLRARNAKRVKAATKKTQDDEGGLLLDFASFTCYLVALQKQRLGD